MLQDTILDELEESEREQESSKEGGNSNADVAYTEDEEDPTLVEKTEMAQEAPVDDADEVVVLSSTPPRPIAQICIL